MTRRILAFADMLQAEAPELDWIRYAINWLGISLDQARFHIQKAIDSGEMVIVRTEVLA